MYSCPNCQATNSFMAYKDGLLIRVLEDNEDREGLDTVMELLCLDCNEWFPNPFVDGAKDRTLVCELVTATGLKGKGTVKVIATGVSFPFDFQTHVEDAVMALRGQSREFRANLLEFASHRGHELCLRVKEEGNPNTWLYRLSRKQVEKHLKQ